MAYIRGDGLRKVYDPDGKAVEALHNVNFSIEKGEFVSIIGPSGCGKSTLLMMCGGLEDISDGLLMVGGTPMTGPRRDMGVMFQDPTLLPWKTVMENVLFPARIARMPIGPVEHRAVESDGAKGGVGGEEIDDFLRRGAFHIARGKSGVDRPDLRRMDGEHAAEAIPARFFRERPQAGLVAEIGLDCLHRRHTGGRGADQA